MTIVSKADVVIRFNNIVRNGQSSVDGAIWYLNNVPGAPAQIRTHSNLGLQGEATMTVGDIPGQALASTVFNVLHNFAQRLTRVRQGFYIFVQNSGSSFTPSWISDGYKLTAFNEGLALHFPIPTPYPNPGDLVEDSVLNTFLADLRNEVAARRGNSAYGQVMYACHSSCHSSCHGSRGRR